MQKFLLNGRISLRMIRSFLILAEELHFGKAAERLHVSQPPLSALIKELEEVLGFRLFARDSRNVELTKAGLMMQSEMRQVVDSLESALSRVCHVGRYQQQHINIGIIGTAICHRLLDKLKFCQELNPEMTWSLHELPPYHQQQALLKNSIDVGFWRCAHLEPNIAFTTQCIQQQRIMLAVHRDNPLSQRSSVSIRDLVEQTVIFLTFKNSRFSQELHDSCIKINCPPAKVLQVNEPQTQIALINSNLGVALMPEDMQDTPWPNIHFVPLQQKLCADLYAVYNTNNLSPALSSLLTLFQPNG